jgi:hypothetical protein
MQMAMRFAAGAVSGLRASTLPIDRMKPANMTDLRAMLDAIMAGRA